MHAIWYPGHVLTQLEEFGRANAAFVAALKLGPNDLNALHQVGVLAAKQGDWGSLRYQIQDLEQAVARSGRPDQMRRVYHLQGELAIAQGNPKKAHELLEKANGLFPHPLYQDAIAPRLPRQGESGRGRGDLSSDRRVYGSEARRARLLREDPTRARECP